MTVTVYRPQFTAKVYKRIQRAGSGVSQRYAQARRLLDLTPFLGDGCSIETNKNIRQPAGAFAITIVDRADTQPGGIADTLYGFIEPMDYVEIRGARSPEQYANANLPIIMRGWVTEVTRHELMGQDGLPTRRVVIAGQDYGKIPQMYQLLLTLQYGNGQKFLTDNRLWVTFGVPVWQTGSQFVQNVVDALLNPFLSEMASVTDTAGLVPLFSVKATVKEGLVSLPTPAQYWDDSAWSLLTSWTDLAWNELFVDEGETQPTIVYRPIPFSTAASAVAGAPRTVTGESLPMSEASLSDDDLVASVLSRSDLDTANFFWVEAPVVMLEKQDFLNAAALTRGIEVAGSDTNSDPKLYGQRKLEARMQMVDNPSRTPTDSWFDRRRRLLTDLNVDNVVWERGHFEIKGNERIRPGTYVPVRRGELSSLYYVYGVTHRFVPFQSYTSHLLVERGTGFLKRRQHPTSPWAAEGRQGPYRGA